MINSKQETTEFLRSMVRDYDTVIELYAPLAELVNCRQRPAFTAAQAAQMECLRAQCFAFCNTNGLNLEDIALEVQEQEYEIKGWFGQAPVSVGTCF